MTNGTLEAAHAQILEWYLAGENPPAIAKRLGCSRQAVNKYLKKHEAEFKPAVQALVDAVVSNWLSDKTQRLNRLATMFDELREVVNDHGYMVTEESIIEEGEGVSLKRTIDRTNKFNGALPQQLRGILSDAAAELGQIPRPDQNINLKAQVLYRQIVGFDPAELG